MIATQNGLAKFTPASEFRITNRGGVGLKAITLKSDAVVSVANAPGTGSIFVSTSFGVVNRIKAGTVSCQGRNSKGVNLIKLLEGDTVKEVSFHPNVKS